MAPTIQKLRVIFFYLAAGVLTSSAESPFKFESTRGKLPKNVVPRHYAINLQPDLENFITTGKVDINIEVLKPTREIVINALDLEITKAAITAPRTIPLEPKLMPKRRRFRLRFRKLWRRASTH